MSVYSSQDSRVSTIFIKEQVENKEDHKLTSQFLLWVNALSPSTGKEGQGTLQGQNCGSGQKIYYVSRGSGGKSRVKAQSSRRSSGVLKLDAKLKSKAALARAAIASDLVSSFCLLGGDKINTSVPSRAVISIQQRAQSRSS